MVTLISIDVGPRCVREFPDGANMVTDVFAAGAEIEISLAIILGLLSGSDPQAAAIVLRQMRSVSDQEKAVLNVASARMTPEGFSIAKIASEAIGGHRTRRNRFAHNPWASSKELPGAIFLVETTMLARYLTGLARGARGAAEGLLPFEIEDRSIYRSAEVQQARDEARDAASIMRLLVQYVAACHRPDFIGYSTTPEKALADLRAMDLFANTEKAFRAKEEANRRKRERSRS